MSIDPKTVLMLAALMLSGGGSFAIYADNGALRGEVKVLQYQVADYKSIVDKMSDQIYAGECD